MQELCIRAAMMDTRPVGLTMAQWIVDHKDQLCGRIKLIFQPAEEGVRGGAAQAASGLLDDVNYLLGAHLAMMCPTERFVCTPRAYCAQLS